MRFFLIRHQLSKTRLSCPSRKYFSSQRWRFPRKARWRKTMLSSRPAKTMLAPRPASTVKIRQTRPTRLAWACPTRTNPSQTFFRLLGPSWALVCWQVWVADRHPARRARRAPTDIVADISVTFQSLRESRGLLSLWDRSETICTELKQ